MNIEIANRFVTLRKTNGLSQEALAEKLGISRQAVSKWERAEASPDTDNLILLAKIYNVSLDELLFSEEEPIPANESNHSNDTEPTMKKEDPQKFSGIHLKSSDGELYIGRNGIYATDFEKQESVHIKDTAHITIDGQNYTFKEAREKWGHKHHHFPVALIAILIYVSIGVFYNIWHPTWLIFFLIPISSGIISAFRHNSWKRLPYPFLITTIYFGLGFLYNAWHPAWILFLTIPLFYSLVHYFRPKKITSPKVDSPSDI